MTLSLFDHKVDRAIGEFFLGTKRKHYQVSRIDSRCRIIWINVRKFHMANPFSRLRLALDRAKPSAAPASLSLGGYNGDWIECVISNTKEPVFERGPGVRDMIAEAVRVQWLDDTARTDDKGPIDRSDPTGMGFGDACHRMFLELQKYNSAHQTGFAQITLQSAILSLECEPAEVETTLKWAANQCGFELSDLSWSMMGLDQPGERVLVLLTDTPRSVNLAQIIGDGVNAALQSR